MLESVLNVWDRIQDLGKSIESYTKVTQGPREPFSDFLQTLTKAVHMALEHQGMIRRYLVAKNQIFGESHYVRLYVMNTYCSYVVQQS